MTLTACPCRKRLSVFLPFWNNRLGRSGVDHRRQRARAVPIASPNRAPATRTSHASAHAPRTREWPRRGGRRRERGRDSVSRARGCRSDGASRGVPYFKHVRARHERARRCAHLGRGGGLPQRGAPVGDRVGFGGERPTDRAARAAIYPRAHLGKLSFRRRSTPAPALLSRPAPADRETSRRDRAPSDPAPRPITTRRATERPRDGRAESRPHPREPRRWLADRRAAVARTTARSKERDRLIPTTRARRSKARRAPFASRARGRCGSSRRTWRFAPGTSCDGSRARGVR